MSIPHPLERATHLPRSEEDRFHLSAQLINWVAGRILDAAEPGWARIEVKVLGSGLDYDVKYAILNADGSTGVGEFPAVAMRAIDDLRHLRYEEELGTWFSLRMHLEPPDYLDAKYNVDVDPLWDPPIDASAYQEDLRYFPRTEANIPRWLQQKLHPNRLLPRILPQPDQLAWYKDLVVSQVYVSLPVGWTYAQLHFRELGNQRELNGLVQDISGKLTPWTPPVAVADRFSELRSASRTPSESWFSARFELKFGDSSARIITRGNSEPAWSTPPSENDFTEEIEQFRLNGVPIPDWLTRR
ncbi:hypothetical protein ACFYTF_18220 [Nocardia thailandica]|uniref:Uncharacterized protein n=1 Tax=Nocardia thailandica TaxID=257275 RepID=A0ABW6PRB8_9NOCA